MNKWLALLCLLFLCPSLMAQSGRADKDDHTLPMVYAGSHWSYTLISSLTKPARIRRTSGNIPLGSTAVSGFEFGVNLHMPLSPQYSIITGFHLGESGRDFTLTIPKEAFQPPMVFDYTSSGAISRSADFYMSFPLLIEKRWLQERGHHWNLQGGMNLRYAFNDFTEGASGSYIDANGQERELYRFNLVVGSGNKPWVNYNLGGGYSRLLRNLNVLRVNLLLNYSCTDIARGTYTITSPDGSVTTGTYTSDLSYAGVSMSYILTRARKRMRRIQ